MSDDDRTQPEDETLPRLQSDEQQRVDDAIERNRDRQRRMSSMGLCPEKDWVKD